LSVIRKAFRGLLAFLLILATPIVCTALVLWALVFLPLPATIPQPKAEQRASTSYVFDADGNQIGTYRQFDSSIPVQPQDIPQVLKDAVVAAEDQSFYEHGGVDLYSTVRALWADIQNQQVVEGGSTITQQYVKNAFTGDERTIGRKVHEAILAGQLDRSLDKDTILYRYLSTIYFGEGAYGVGAAAETYFRKPVNELTLPEAALLAEVIPAPSQYSPRVNPLLAEGRRRGVLQKMLDQHKITQAGYDMAFAAPVWLQANGDPPGPATIVYPPEQQESQYPFFTDYVHQWLEQNLPGCAPHACPLLDEGGLRIVTTLDPKMQQAAQEETDRTLGKNPPELQMSLVSVEPPTGYVRAMIGGRDYASSQFNVATLEPGRQPGSSFKPFILATAFEEGIQPTKTYSGAPYQVPGTKDVIQNYGGEQFGTIDLRTATWDSVNGVYARLIEDVGVDKAMAMAQRLGVNQPAYDPSVYGASVALGVTDATPLEMASAYGVFANHGKRAAPTPVLQVIGPDGKVIIDNTNAASKAQPVISDVVADNVTDVLRGVLTDGTAKGKDIGRPAAGKTGTAEGPANAWFVGYTPTLSTAVWLGKPDCGNPADKNCLLKNINGVGDVTGGTLPAQTWQRYMKRALDGVEPTDFSQPAPIQTFADTAQRQARQGFDPGVRKYPAKPPAGGPSIQGVPTPEASSPTTSTSTTTPSSSTTSTVPKKTTTTSKPGGH
jgi:penicillin-binding protein 1A